jgi:hypothetical protein
MRGSGEENVEGLGGKPEGKRQLEIPKCKLEDGSRIADREIGFGGGGCCGIVWLRIGTGGGLS